MPLDLMKMLRKNQLIVTGSKSYLEGQCMPEEACNPSEEPESRFGGLFNQKDGFFLKYEFI